jgi:hypothetical protein
MVTISQKEFQRVKVIENAAPTAISTENRRETAGSEPS